MSLERWGVKQALVASECWLKMDTQGSGRLSTDELTPLKSRTPDGEGTVDEGVFFLIDFITERVTHWFLM